MELDECTPSPVGAVVEVVVVVVVVVVGVTVVTVSVAGGAMGAGVWVTVKLTEAVIFGGVAMGT